MYDPNKRLIDATLSDLEEILSSALIKAMSGKRTSQIDEEENDAMTPAIDTVRKGLDGIMEALMCGKTKAVEVKKQGIIDEAIEYIGARDYIVHVEKARQLYNNHFQKVS